MSLGGDTSWEMVGPEWETNKTLECLMLHSPLTLDAATKTDFDEIKKQ
jgi:hypothetical protein